MKSKKLSWDSDKEKRKNMKTSSAITRMYKIFVDKEGPVLAKETITSILYIVLSEIESDGLELNDALLDDRLGQELEKILKASNKDVA